MDDFVANPWSGPIVAVALWFAALGLWLRLRRRLLRLCAGCLGLFAVALGVGTTAERLQRDHFLADFPAPGRLIDVGGFRLHLLCQGPQTAGVTIVWIAGGYGQGLWLNHLHKAVLDHARSCLFDPAGTGWSDSGPFPRTIDRQVEELHRTLAGAGENGPFLLVGHSLGGMLAANYAGRHPEEVAGLVALDGITTIDSSLRREFPCPQMVLAGRVLAWLNRFGLMTIWPSLNPYAGADAATQYAPLAAVWPQIAPQETRVGAVLGEASAVGQSCMGAGDLVRTAGALGALPILSIVQPLGPGDEPADAQGIQLRLDGTRDFQERNGRQLVNASRLEFADYSRNGRVISAPAGTTHDFPIEAPAFVIDQVLRFRATVASVQVSETRQIQPGEPQ